MGAEGGQDRDALVGVFDNAAQAAHDGEVGIGAGRQKMPIDATIETRAPLKPSSRAMTACQRPSSPVACVDVVFIPHDIRPGR